MLSYDLKGLSDEELLTAYAVLEKAESDAEDDPLHPNLGQIADDLAEICVEILERIEGLINE